MLMNILGSFLQVINSLRNIPINLGGIEMNLFTLLFGILIFAILCRTYLKFILDLPLNAQSLLNKHYDDIHKADIKVINDLKSKVVYYEYK